MKRFLLKIFWFIFPLLALAFPLDLLISHNLKKSNDALDEFEVWNDIYDGKASCDVAVYGSSRAAVHINPKILEDSLRKSVYNFGMIGQHFPIQYLRHLEFIKYNEKPKLIILSFDSFSFDENKDLYYQSQFFPYLLFNENIREYTSGYSGFSKFDYYLPLARYFGKTETLNKAVKNFLKPQGEVIKSRYKGYYEGAKEWDEQYDRAHTKKEKYRMILAQQYIDLFERFINECKNSDIDLVLVYTPEYIESQQVVINREEIIDLYRRFAIKYNLSFLDYSKDEISFQKKYFFDSQHLNSKGSDVFTEKLASKLKEIYPE